jgi:DNA ligase D-like protein (predicted 3'-phosphoesterase)
MSTSKFIITEHSAKKAGKHYDLRFKIPTSKNWASFACRKKIPLSPGTKILAVKTNDHSEKEALFIGTIETGYGAGVLKKWDDGSCIIEKYSISHIVINFKGSKIKGIYHLINTGVMNKDYKKRNFLLFKGKL